MEAEGYTFEYGLDNEPYDLRKMEKGGEIKGYKKTQSEIKDYLESFKRVGEVQSYFDKDRNGDYGGDFVVKYDIEDEFNYTVKDISVNYEKKNVFIRLIGNFNFKNISDLKKILKDNLFKEPIYEKGGKTPNYDYDYEDIGQFSMKDDNWKYFTQEDFRDIGKEITETAFNGDLDVAYESIVKQRSSFEKGGMTKEDYLKKKFDVREFVDEDTGELVPIEIPIDRDKRVSKSYSPSERRRERKRELKDFQRMEELQDLQGDIDTLKYKLEDEKKHYDSLFVDQDVEAGQKGENWSDDDANRYGVMMNESAEKIAAIKLLIDKKQKEYNEKESSYSEFY